MGDDDPPEQSKPVPFASLAAAVDAIREAASDDDPPEQSKPAPLASLVAAVEAIQAAASDDDPPEQSKPAPLASLVAAVEAIEAADGQVADESEWPEEVPPGHPAWKAVKRDSTSGAYFFDLRRPNGERVRCQTTPLCCRSSSELTARLARLLYIYAEEGHSKDRVLEYRSELYRRYGSPPAKSGMRKGAPPKAVESVEGGEGPELSLASLANIDEDVDDAPLCHRSYRALTHDKGSGTIWFEFMRGDERIRFQTTVQASGGCAEEAARIARLAYVMVEAGADKDTVMQFRSDQYRRIALQVGGLRDVRDMFFKG